ncbi:MAG: 1-deoxy-D-xylulose-5-phosphate reductoisomerase [Tunicatimonas sp.]
MSNTPQDAPPRRLAIIGSTGSIGTQALEVVRNHPQKFTVEVLTAHRNAELLIQQSKKFRPNAVVIVDEAKYATVQEALDPLDVKVYTGAAALAEIVTMDTIDLVLTATVGYSGLLPTIRAIEAQKTIALANKETLVVAGELITQLAKKNGVSIFPVDSEHSAIFQCLVGEFHNPIEKIILTASGGPFRGKDQAYLKNVTKEQALKHPNWEMGAKVTIDSASLMNKGLEVIEAQWLFGLTPEQIEVVVHPQSIIHSLVQFADSSLKAQLGLPDMRVPIQFALSYPQRLPNTLPRFSFLDYPELTFERPDTDTFRNLSLAYEAMRQGGNVPCVLNAANEVAVSEFLRGNIGFLDMSTLVERCMEKMPYIRRPNHEDYVATNDETRSKALELLKELR